MNTDLQPNPTAAHGAQAETRLPTRFGLLPFAPHAVWLAQTPLPGFESLQRYGLISVQAERPFVWLQSLDDPAISFLLVQPEHFGLRYADLPEAALPLVMVLLPGRPGLPLRAHRQAPLLFDAQRGVLAQHIVEPDAVHGGGDFAPLPTVWLPPALLRRVVMLG
jgi:flagellar assembly factor FliW